MTDTLVAKQATLEAVQNEKKSLALQLERANANVQSPDQLSLVRHSNNGNDHSTRVSLNITDDGKVLIGVNIVRSLITV